MMPREVGVTIRSRSVVSSTSRLCPCPYQLMHAESKALAVNVRDRGSSSHGGACGTSSSAPGAAAARSRDLGMPGPESSVSSIPALSRASSEELRGRPARIRRSPARRLPLRRRVRVLFFGSPAPARWPACGVVGRFRAAPPTKVVLAGVSPPRVGHRRVHDGDTFCLRRVLRPLLPLARLAFGCLT